MKWEYQIDERRHQMKILGDQKEGTECKFRMKNGKWKIGRTEGVGWKYKVNERKQPNGKKGPDERKVAGENIRRMKGRYRMRGIKGRYRMEEG